MMIIINDRLFYPFITCFFFIVAFIFYTFLSGLKLICIKDVLYKNV